MWTLLECYIRAAKCEADALSTNDEDNRRVLLALSEQWRKLGDSADDHKARIARSYDRSR